jgi:hypothetical protein
MVMEMRFMQWHYHKQTAKVPLDGYVIREHERDTFSYVMRVRFCHRSLRTRMRLEVYEIHVH